MWLSSELHKRIQLKLVWIVVIQNCFKKPNQMKPALLQDLETGDRYEIPSNTNSKFRNTKINLRNNHKRINSK